MLMGDSSSTGIAKGVYTGTLSKKVVELVGGVVAQGSGLSLSLCLSLCLSLRLSLRLSLSLLFLLLLQEV